MGYPAQYASPQGVTANSPGAPQYWYPGQASPTQYSVPYHQGAPPAPNHGDRRRRDSQQTQASSSRQIVVARVQRGPPEAVTDPSALHEGVQATARVSGGSKLDPSKTPLPQTRLRLTALIGFKVRPHGWKFFIVGKVSLYRPHKCYSNRSKVFKLYWPEPAGDGSATDITEDKRFGERIFCKIRWFIVVKQGKDCSTCV